MIRADDVRKRFDKVQALAGVSVAIEPGERVAFVGSNASGKTTLLRAIAGLLRVEGTITIGGVDVAKKPEIALRNVAYIPQIAPPIDAPVGEIVRALASLRGIEERAVGAAAERLGFDVGAVKKTRFRDLSGGMKQKILAAVALACAAPILVCDEPTANLDAATRARFFQAVSERPAGSILVLCSHRLEEVRHLVDRVVELRDGKVRRDVPVATLLAEVATFRVEVALDPAAAELHDELVARGFVPAGAGRVAALLTQSEKLDVLELLLARHAREVRDVAVYDTDEIAIVPAPAPLSEAAE